MQLSRIKRMSEKRKRAWIKAIDELVEEYKNDTQSTSNCPLCITWCSGCLWHIIEGCDCTYYYWKDYVGIPAKWEKEDYKAWKPLRLKMLKRWRRIIKEGLNEI